MSLGSGEDARCIGGVRSEENVAMLLFLRVILPRSLFVCCEIYRPLVEKDSPLVVKEIRTAVGKAGLRLRLHITRRLESVTPLYGYNWSVSLSNPRPAILDHLSVRLLG